MSTISLNYKRTGEGQPILIVHGLFGSLDNWQTMAKLISEEGFEVITVDLRNHGKSPHTAEMDHALMAEDVQQLITDLELEHCIVIGHSMGGKTAIKLAESNDLEKLIVVDIAPKPYPAHHNTYFDAMRTLNLSQLKSRSQAKELLAEKIKNQAILQFIAKNIQRTETGFTWKFNLESLYNNYDKLIGGIEFSPIETPTLFIAGKNSDYISKGDEAKIAELFPNAQIEVIEKAGHWVHAEQPDAFFTVVMGFIQ